MKGVFAVGLLSVPVLGCGVVLAPVSMADTAKEPYTCTIKEGTVSITSKSDNFIVTAKINYTSESDDRCEPISFEKMPIPKSAVDIKKKDSEHCVITVPFTGTGEEGNDTEKVNGKKAEVVVPIGGGDGIIDVKNVDTVDKSGDAKVSFDGKIKGLKLKSCSPDDFDGDATLTGKITVTPQ
ncbi:hypothetical protein [Nocardia terpenica]|uniref:Uncharacterized protein n=1 Tax=Nocardia terpenica TaxID=455432 RepID=A0A291RRW4_9NOCA|nr:hypothetical protein [Nocardia terpenica]ATL70361.1 hypothetical protein CRH09_33465 [Nocardia terpenica]